MSVLGASLGWHEGNWHWSIGTLVNVPIGYWERGDPTNIGFNRWAADLTGAVTYLDLKSVEQPESSVALTNGR